MELKGKLVAKLPVTTYGKEGKKKGGLVIEYGDKYPKKAAFTVFERNLPSLDGINAGDEMIVEFSVESREWQGKWFTDAIAIKVAPTNGFNKKEETFQVPDQDDDLPF